MKMMTQQTDKQKDRLRVYYTIGQMAELLGESESCVRYWNNEFASYVKPHRNKKDNRLFTDKDLSALRSIKYLLRERGMTISGARECLANSRRSKRRPEETDVADTELSVKSEVIARLQGIREQLLKIDQYI